ncbi:MAG: radical SAM protein [Candidatus Aminicenantes bacterium]|nr:radical SAM protein [Candidatus Aminicenantes bacterium]
MDNLISLIAEIKARIDKGKFEGLSKDEALILSELPVSLYTAIFDLSTQINSKTRKKVDKCGSFYSDVSPCAEDCAFCPFSHDHYTSLNLEQQTSEILIENMLKYADRIAALGINHFKIVSTGLRADDAHIEKVCEGIVAVKLKHPNLQICVSMGLLSESNLLKLREAGADFYNNNLETSEKHFNKIISSHTLQQKIDVIRLAKRMGYSICSGGIFGVGENLKERIDLFFLIKELKVESSPFNIFVRYDNIPLSSMVGEKQISTLEIFLSLAFFRLVYPQCRIVLGGGRDFYLSEMEQEFALLVGATALQSSNALNAKGTIDRIIKDDKLFNNVLNENE